METIFLVITKKVMFSSNNRNCIRNKIRKFKILFLTFHLTFYIYFFHILLLFENLMNDTTSYLTSLLCNYHIMVRGITNEIIKKIIILISTIIME